MLSLDRLQNSSARIMTLELKLQADVDTLNDMVPGRDAMLKGIDPIIHAELLHVLMLMGHGDDLVICDINHPAATIAANTAYGSLINLSGCGLAEATRAILTLFPLDTFVEKPVCRMEVVGDPERQMPVFAQIQHIIDAAEGRPVPMQPLERFAFYEAASRSFAIVRTSDPGPYGCFILKKGVISNPSFTASPPGI